VYIPPLFCEESLAEMQEMMETYNFATLVTVDQGIPFATHLPFMLDRTSGAHGTLLAHMARANPQWTHFATGQEVLVIFQGPHAYISPAWYESDFAVPTWNYIAVHAYGIPSIVDDPWLVQQMLDKLVARHETPRPEPWRFAWTERYVNLSKGVVAFTLGITRLEGKAKLSQNRTEADRRGAIQGLQNSGEAGDRLVAAQMAARLANEEARR
jgi:transcriptional regulator